MLKLLLTEILPNTLDRVIVMDTDMIANAHIGELWQYFNQFTWKQRRGHALYELSVHGKKEIHHINHIRRRDPNTCDRPEDIRELPLDILLDTFELLTNTAESNTEERVARENPIIEPRHSRRTRAIIKRLSVDPSKGSYE
ncbi:hypothetical protein EG68_01225 [Paragonimus skrjabini miyazakii]|uniref:Uncharacterized protein n=1 Tax=Paragonimus skrjabini miyazakii TaxID=59628 RepID=A0A8S9ZBB5_9TREM|nr:hypothetical protein EG68_01225 [Paragonimus skrjabini miyazakii]